MVIQKSVNLFIIITGLWIILLFRVVVAHVPVARATLETLRNVEGTINHNIDPCDDFYEYACGNFQNFHNQPTLTLAMNYFNTAITNIVIQKISTLKQNQSVIDKAGIFYQSCQNLDAWKLLRYLDELKPAPGLEWPLVEEQLAEDAAERPWDAQKFDVLEFVALLNSYGVRKTFVNYKFSTDVFRTFLQLTPADPEELYPQEVEEILKHFKFSKETLTKYRDEILHVHLRWQSIYKSYNETNEYLFANYNKLEKSYPKLAAFLKKSIAGDIFNYSQLNLIYVPDMRFIQFLMDKQWQPAEKREFCNYLMIKYLQHIKKNHRRNCLNDLGTKMGLAVNYMYYENYYLSEAKEFNAKITQLSREIQDNLWEVVTENRMNYNEAQMEYITARVNGTAVNIGNLPKGVNLTTVEEFYREIPTFDINNFYKNDLLMLRQQELEIFICQKDYSWSCSRNYGNSPFNTANFNIVSVPYGSLNLPFYHHSLDPVFSLSGMGFVLGHEFTHSIEAETLEIFNQTFFEKITENPIFRNSRDCMMQQYPTNDMLERVADVVGTRVAYRAYARVYNSQPKFTTTPWQQLFFVNLVKMFCNHLEPEVGHDLGDMRVREIAMNSDEFAAAFQCPVGSKMNPEKKCHCYY